MKKHLTIVVVLLLLLTACTPAQFGGWARRSGFGQPDRGQRVELAGEASRFWAQDCAWEKYLERGYDLDALPRIQRDRYEKRHMANPCGSLIDYSPIPIPKDWIPVVERAAKVYNVDPRGMAWKAWCESNFNRTAVNSIYVKGGGRAHGPWQHLENYWPARATNAGYDGASIFNLEAQAHVTAQMIAETGSWPWKASARTHPNHCLGGWNYAGGYPITDYR